ncbi:hypothetical protein BJ912DRAFT_42190 [Pholiota molesta]|nr:hypothetical protein BJ912DRAFT_42190 [Pholiota molesta]
MTTSTSTHLPQWYGCWPPVPAPLSAQVNRWLWLSMAVSLSIPATFAFRHLHSQTPMTDTPNSPSGGHETFSVALGIVAALYSTFLLILARKERRLTVAEEAMVDIEDATQAVRLRSTLSLLMVAVCQSFLAALFLYVGARVAFLLRVSGEHASTSHPLFAYGDFVFVVGQMGLMGYVIFCCVLHEAKIEAYLSVRNTLRAGKRRYR